MGGTGPMPKAQHQRERNTRYREGEFRTVHDDGELRGPELGGNHHPETVDWYAEWRTVPQSQLFTPTDWRRLRMLAPIVDKMAAGVATVAERSELRLNESLLGATYGDRLKLRIRVATSDPSQTVAPVTALDRRDVRERAARRSAALIADRDTRIGEGRGTYEVSHPAPF